MVVIVMGVTGVGKTTIGELLAGQLGWNYADADSFHSPENVEKMRQGIPLDDADRRPWLEAMRSAITGWISKKQNAVLACSALKRVYRVELAVNDEVKFVYLKGSYQLIAQRLHSRLGHFAKESILADQFATLEEPEDVVTVGVDQPPEEIVIEIREELGLGQAF